MWQTRTKHAFSLKISMSATKSMPPCKDFFETKEASCSGTEYQEEEKRVAQEKIGQEWWDRNWVWHYRSPYVTGELMDKLEPYIKKLETTPAWQAYDKYFRSIGPFTEEINVETRWKIAREWYEREDPTAFWNKVYKHEEKNKALKKSAAKSWRRKYQDSVKVISTE